MQPHDHKEFYATAKLGKLGKLASKTLQKDQALLKPIDFRETAKIICAKSSQNMEHLPDCFSLIFYFYFLKALGFTNESSHLEFTKKINNGTESTGWTES